MWILLLKTNDFYEGISYVEKQIDTLDYGERRKKKTSTCRKENKKVIDIMKGKTGGKIIIDFAATGLKHKAMKYKKMIIK